MGLGHTHATFNPSNAAHELCHHTDGVTHAAFNPSNIVTRNNTAGCNTMTMNSVTALMTSHNIVTRNNTAELQHPGHELCHRTDDVTQHRGSQ
jgi:hypothetical protein